MRKAQVDKEIARKGEFYNDNWRQLKRQLRSIRGRERSFGETKIRSWASYLSIRRRASAVAGK